MDTIPIDVLIMVLFRAWSRQRQSTLAMVCKRWSSALWCKAFIEVYSTQNIANRWPLKLVHIKYNEMSFIRRVMWFKSSSMNWLWTDLCRLAIPEHILDMLGYITLGTRPLPRQVPSMLRPLNNSLTEHLVCVIHSHAHRYNIAPIALAMYARMTACTLPIEYVLRQLTPTEICHAAGIAVVSTTFIGHTSSIINYAKTKVNHKCPNTDLRVTSARSTAHVPELVYAGGGVSMLLAKAHPDLPVSYIKQAYSQGVGVRDINALCHFTNFDPTDMWYLHREVSAGTSPNVINMLIDMLPMPLTPDQAIPLLQMCSHYKSVRILQHQRHLLTGPMSSAVIYAMLVGMNQHNVFRSKVVIEVLIALGCDVVDTLIKVLYECCKNGAHSYIHHILTFGLFTPPPDLCAHC